MSSKTSRFLVDANETVYLFHKWAKSSVDNEQKALVENKKGEVLTQYWDIDTGHLLAQQNIGNQGEWLLPTDDKYEK